MSKYLCTNSCCITFCNTMEKLLKIWQEESAKWTLWKWFTLEFVWNVECWELNSEHIPEDIVYINIILQVKHISCLGREKNSLVFPANLFLKKFSSHPKKSDDFVPVWRLFLEDGDAAVDRGWKLSGWEVDGIAGMRWCYGATIKVSLDTNIVIFEFSPSHCKVYLPL